MIDAYYKLLLLLGYLKKILVVNQFSSGKNFKLFFTGGIIGSKEKIVIGDNVSLHGWLISDGGKIKIKENTVIHKGTIIRAMNYIEIGKNCDIGGDCYIQDHNSMSLNYLDRRKHAGEILNSPIHIGDDVWIGRRVTVLKGVTIGDRGIIGTNAVVAKSVPRDTTAVGNPAKPIKKHPSYATSS